MNKSSGRVECRNPKLTAYIAQNMFLESPVIRKKSRFRPIAFVVTLALVLVFSGVFALLISMATAADSSASVTINSLGDFSQARELFPDVFVPNKIPGRYSFQSLTVTKTYAGSCRAEYIYSEKDGSLLKIKQVTCRERPSLKNLGATEELKTGDGTIFIAEKPKGSDQNHAEFIKSGAVIDITGSLEKGEILGLFAYRPEQNE